MFKKYTNKIILVLGLFLTFFCFNTVSACSDDRGHNIVSYDYSATTGFIELGITFDGYMDYDQCWDGCWNEYSGFVDNSKDPFAGLYLYNSGNKYLGGVKYVSGCGYHASSGLEWASATTGNTCTVCFSELWTYSSYDYSTTLLLSSAGTCLTKAEIDGYYTDFLENIRVDGISLHDSDAYFSLYGTAMTNFDFATCDVKVGSIVPPLPIDGVCGDVSTFDFDDFNDQDFCSSGDFYPVADNGERMYYDCISPNGGTSQYNCFADYYYNLDPTITDVIDFDFDDFTYDFDEGDVSKNWLIDIFKFLFLPREATLQKFFTTFDNFKEKIPFGYIYLIQNQIKQVSLESTDELALNLDLLGEDYELFSITSLKQDIGENTFNIIYDTMRALIWLVFVLYLITRSQKLFNNND